MPALLLFRKRRLEFGPPTALKPRLELSPSSFIRFTSLLAIVILALAAVIVRGQTPVGLPALVSPSDGRDHVRPAVAAGPAGAVVVWQGQNPASGTYDIFARLYGRDGSPRGPAFVANQDTAFDQRRPVVAMNASGSFLLIWDGPGAGDSQGIFARRFSASGAPLGNQFALNQTTARGQFAPTVALAADGSFVVAWHGNVAGDSSGVTFRRFAADNRPLSGETLPYDAAALDSDQRAASLAMAADGSFALAWEELSYAQDGTAGFTIRLRRYSAAGVPLGPAVAAAFASDPDTVESPALALDADGNLAIVWARNDAAGATIELRRAAAGGALGAPLLINSGPENACLEPFAAFDPDGALLTAWSDAGTLNGAPIGLAGRLFPPGGGMPTELIYPALPTGYPSMMVMTVAAGSPGSSEWLVVWDNEQPTGGLPVSNVYLRRLGLPGINVSTGGKLALEEGKAPVSLRLSLRTLPAAPVRITLTPASRQLILGGGSPGAALTISFTPDAAAPREVTVAIADDSIAEGPREATLILSVGSDDPAYAAAPLLIDGQAGDRITFMVSEHDQAQYSVTASSAELPEEEGVATLTISRGGAIGGSGSVRYSLAGSATFDRDYQIVGGSAQATGASGTISFGPNESVKTILLAGIDNSALNQERLIRLTLSDPLPAAASTITQASATITMIDDDAPEPEDPFRLYLPLLRK